MHDTIVASADYFTGGIYEDDAFFDACDSYGVLVWQDFCFACGNYPTYPSFLKSVEREARQNVRRLRSHPSLVIWAGSNEDYQVQERYKLDYDYDDKDPDSWLQSSFPARYYYEYLLPKIVQEEHPSAVYHPTSPWGDGKNTADPTVGDIHQWNSKIFPYLNHDEQYTSSDDSSSLARDHGKIPVCPDSERSLHQRVWNGSLPAPGDNPVRRHQARSTASRVGYHGFSQQGNRPGTPPCELRC